MKLENRAKKGNYKTHLWSKVSHLKYLNMSIWTVCMISMGLKVSTDSLLFWNTKQSCCFHSQIPATEQRPSAPSLSLAHHTYVNSEALTLTHYVILALIYPQHACRGKHHADFFLLSMVCKCQCVCALNPWCNIDLIKKVDATDGQGVILLKMGKSAYCK